MKEKLDVLDLVIAVLREHEKRLDELVSRLERVLEREEFQRREKKLLKKFYEEWR